MPELHFDLERHAVRVVLTDEGGRILLFHALTPDQIPDGWWELPGGGIDPGETYLEAAVREIREETGLILDPGAVGPPAWRRDDHLEVARRPAAAARGGRASPGGRRPPGDH